MSVKICEITHAVLVKDLVLKIVKKCQIKPKPTLTLWKTLLTDGIEMIQVVDFKFNYFMKYAENDIVKLTYFMPKECNTKDTFYFKLNNKHLELSSNSSSKVERISDNKIPSPEILDITDIDQMNFSGKSIISVKAVMLNINESFFSPSNSHTKRNISCHAFDLNGKLLDKFKKE